jgi:hypothetical protein
LPNISSFTWGGGASNHTDGFLAYDCGGGVFIVAFVTLNCHAADGSNPLKSYLSIGLSIYWSTLIWSNGSAGLLAPTLGGIGTVKAVVNSCDPLDLTGNFSLSMCDGSTQTVTVNITL